MQAIPTSSKTDSASISQLFSYPFRIFFLSMTLLALLVIPALGVTSNWHYQHATGNTWVILAPTRDAIRLFIGCHRRVLADRRVRMDPN